jgi:transposase
MNYVRQPSDEEHTELRRMSRQEVGRVSQRAQMVLMSAQRRSVPEIARIFSLSKATVRYWLRQFDAKGPDGLYDQPRSGRPRKINPLVAETIVGMIQEDPQCEGYLPTFWTVAMLVLALTQRLTMRLSLSTMRNALHQLGLRWGRPRLAMPHKTDPRKAEKQWAIALAVIEAGPNAAVLYADESRVQLLPLVRAMWHWIGQQIRVPTPGTNVSRTLFGALNIHTGQWDHLVRQRATSEDFIAFLEHLLAAYPVEPIILIVDNFSSHRARIVQTWLAANARLRLMYLPTYCSHLNPVECIWLQLKGTLAGNRLYASMALLLQAVDQFFIDLTPQRALTLAGQNVQTIF